MRKLLYILLWIALGGYLVWTGQKVRHAGRAALCTGISIGIADSDRLALISQAELYERMAPLRERYTGTALHALPLSEIETQLEAHPAVKNAETYVTYDGLLHIEVSQRIPLLRVINAYGDDFYIDRDGYILQLTAPHAAYVPVTTGRIAVRPAAVGTQPVHARSGDAGSVFPVLSELYAMAGWLNEHPFWNAQIQEIYVRDDGDFQLVPLVGPVILFGRWQDAEEKFGNLLAFYRNGLNVMGWDHYKQVNVKYRGQVIGTRK